MQFFNVLSYDPAVGRVKFKTATIRSQQRAIAVRLTTKAGSYEMGKDQSVRLVTGEVKPVMSLQPGDLVHACVLLNDDGFIWVETANRRIALHEMLEADTEGLSVYMPPDADKFKHASEAVVSVEEIGAVDGMQVEVECRSANDFSPQDGHNYMIWKDGTSFGAGIFVF
jgi:hypothetical protein